MSGLERSCRGRDPSGSLPELFHAQAEREPAAVAVVCGENALSYGDLEARANQLAHFLQVQGVTAGTLVGVCLDRSFEMIIALLGILKAGGAYLPLDPEYPRERLQFMLEDAQANLVLTQGEFAERLSLEGVHSVCLDAQRGSIAAQSCERPSSSATSDDLGYVIYTSGSTGKPKGVAMVRRALENLIQWQLEDSSVHAGARTLQFAPLSFDVSFQEIFASLASGGELVLVSDDIRLDPERLWRFLGEASIARIFLPFIALQQLADASSRVDDVPTCLREVITAGEQLQTNAAIVAMFNKLSNCKLINHYGPTEAHVVTRYALEGSPSSWPALPAIGRAIPNVVTLVLDAQRKPVAKGETGELYLGGVCLARGYLGHPELTAERFVEDVPEAERLYRTGDLVRELPDGNLEFQGRADDQIKIRGYRIEPGELEVQLADCPYVKDVAVALQCSAAGSKHLVAYVTLSDQQQTTTSALRSFLEARVPDYMIPSRFVVLDALPLTPSGKVDRGGLTSPFGTRPEIAQDYVAPNSDREVQLTALWRELLEINRVGVLDNFFDLGGNSLLCVQVTQRMRREMGMRVPITAPFAQPTIRGLLEYLERSDDSDVQEKARLRVQRRDAKHSSKGIPGTGPSNDVAVVGMAMQLPGAADADTYWQNLLNGVESIERLSDDALRAAGIAEELLADPSYVKAKGLLRDPEAFDAAFFGINPREAQLMDPQQRLFLETCWQALEASGHAPSSTVGAVGVWGGMSTGMRNNTYLLRNLHAVQGQLSPEDQLTAMLGNENDYLTTRVSHKLNLKGPSVSVQSACSTSLTAIAQAYESLTAHHCDMALAGGVCVLFPQQEGYLHQEGDIGSSDGHCRPFDAKADGTVFGDGVGVVVLKRLEDALADGDTIYAVVKSAAINNDGASKMSFGAPSAEGQSEVISLAHALADIDPASIQYIETHGTATPIGDPIEVQGLQLAFGDTPAQSCALGSVKSNLGHLIAAAGVASFAKTVLALHEKTIPPTLHFETPNPELHLEDSPFYINAAAIEWPAVEGPRRAGVSAFGLGGTNVHIVLEEGPATPLETQEFSGACVLPISARTESALETATQALARHCQAHPEVSLADIAFTLQRGRAEFRHRRTLVCRDAQEASEALLSGDRLRMQTRSKRPAAPSVAFLFPGGGAQYIRMGADLYESEPVFRHWIDHGLAWTEEKLDTSLRDVWFPAAGSEELAAKIFERPALQLPAIYILEIALAELWCSRGIEASALIGHSVGEYAAAYLAGCFSFEDGLGLVSLRGRLFEQVPEGGMLSIGLPEAELRQRLGDDLDLAVVNSPELCIVSGPMAALDALAKRLEADDIEAQAVRISIAAHSRMLDPILEEFQHYVEGLELHPPQIPIASNHTGTWLTDAEATSPRYWVDHLRQPVRFSDGIATLIEDPSRILLEVGPGKTLSSLARPRLNSTSGQVAVSSLRHSREDVTDDVFLLDAIGQLWLAGIAIDWDAVLPAEGRTRVSLPTYPFERKRFFIDAQPSVAGAAPASLAQVLPLETQPEHEEIGGPQEDDAANLSRVERITRKLIGILCDLSGLEPADIDRERPFLEMGFDSLFLTQASLAFKREFKVKITFRQLFSEAPYLTALAGFIDESLPEDAVIGVRAPSRAQSTSSVEFDTQEATDGEVSAALADVPLRFGPYKPIDKGADGGLTARQQEHLASLTQQVLERTPSSKALTAEHRDHFADPRAVGGFKMLWKELVYPIAVDHSKGSRMWDIDGNEYIDCVGGFGATFFGHAPDFLVEALGKQLNANLDYGPTSTKAGALAKRICAMTGMERASFCNTGSEAVLATMRTARTVTGRDKIVTFTGDYHGIFDEVLVRAQTMGKTRKNVPVAPGIPGDAASNMIVLEYGDPGALRAIRDRVDEIAGVLVEPVQSRAPDLQPREFIRELRKLTEELEIPLIFDEIITGFRSQPQGAQGFYGVRADIAAYGKVIGGGMPIGVVAGKSLYMDALDGGHWQYGDDSFPEAGVTYFAGTFVRHPLTLAAVESVFDTLEREGPALQEGVNHRCATFAAELNDYFEEQRIPIRFVHFASVILPKWGGDPDFESLFYQHLRVRGVHIWEGRPGFMTTSHTDEDFAELAERFKAAALAMIEGEFLKREDATTESVKGIPLTEAQQELWLTTLVSDEASRSLNEPCAFSLRGRLNLAVLRRSLRQVIARHDALRSSVDPDGSHLFVHPEVETPEIEFFDLTELTDDALREQREKIYREDSSELFDLEHPPLLRVKLLKLEEERHEILFTVHHLVCDGWSIGIFAHDLARFYTSGITGRSLRLEPPMPLEQYAAWENEEQGTEEWRETQEFWKGQYATLPQPIELPLDRPRPKSRSYAGNRQHCVIDREAGNAIKAYATEQKCTLFSALLAAYTAFIHRLTQGEDFSVGIPSAGQALLGANNLIAHCVNYLPFRSQIVPDESFESHLHRIKEQMLLAKEHQGFTYGTLLKSIRAPRDAGRPTLISIDFNLDPAMAELEFSGLKADYISTPRDFARLELQFNVIESDGELLIECDHATDIIDAETARNWMDGFERLLRSVAADPTQRVAELPVLAEGANAVQPDWNATQRDYNLSRCLHQWIEEQVDRTPDATALIFEDQMISYRELDGRANRLAHHLLEIDVQEGDLVAVYLNRGIDLVASLLAIFKSGAAYVPLDPGYPEQRLELLLNDSGAVAVITEQSLCNQLPSVEAKCINLDLEATALATLPDSRPALALQSSNLAYVIHTSGSTGKPKGVLIEHRSVLNVLSSVIEAPGFTSKDVLLSVTTPCFDISVIDMFLPLITGGCAVLTAADTSADGSQLLDLIRKHGVTFLEATPSSWRLLLEAGWSKETPLKAISTGEAMPNELARELLLRTEDVWNLYGPTEATIWSAVHRVENADGPIRIGRPVANTQLHILDESMKPIPVGAVGELFIGGSGLARGYLNKEALTASVFLPDPFSKQASARLYRTGDLARYKQDGTVQCLGRIDDQVKVRGFRIELGEIEAALSACDPVVQSVVAVKEDAMGDKILVAYLRSDADELAPEELRAALKESLPSYMLPQHFIELESFPQTPNGKIDRKALPEPKSVQRKPTGEVIAPSSEMERAILEVWSQLLDDQSFGIMDNFFELGGHSLLAARMLARIQDFAGVRLPLQAVFNNPTVQGLAKTVESSRYIERSATGISADSEINREEFEL